MLSCSSHCSNSSFIQCFQESQIKSQYAQSKKAAAAAAAMGVVVGTAQGAGNNAAPSDEEVRQISSLSQQEEMQVDADDVDAIMEAEQGWISIVQLTSQMSFHRVFHNTGRS